MTNHTIYSDTQEKCDNKPEKGGKAFLARRLACNYVLDRRTVYWGGSLWTHTGTHYRPEDEPDVSMTQWLQQHRIEANGSLRSLILDEVKGYCRLRDRAATPPCWLNGLAAGNIIPFANGLLDLAGGEIGTHTPDLFSVYCLPYPYEPEARCERWLRFLGEVFEGDAERTRLLQQWFGYCLSADVSQQKFMLFLGLPRSGKGTTAQVLQALVGKENALGFDLGRLIDRFSTASLVNKTLAVVGEVELSKHDKPRILEKLKAATGNDALPVERKGKDIQGSAVLPTRWLLSANSMPQLHDASGALAQRMLLLNFNRTFAGREDTGLLDKLLADLPGIAAWAVAGLRDLRQHGWAAPAVSQAARNEFRRASSSPLAFLQDCCQVRRDWLHPLLEGVEGCDDQGCEVQKDWLALGHSHWQAEETGEVDTRAFGWLMRDIKALLPHLSDKQRRTAQGVKRFVQGVRLKPEWQEVVARRANHLR
jgi:putative DNA primase/helicase